MKTVDTDKIEKIPGNRLGETDRFSFRCHAQVSCFNRCCHNLNLFLYPYDCIRLKHHLGISSDEFLDRYVDVVLRPTNFFPDVLLRMEESSEKPCPFLRETGCSVYPDRPDTCRSFPIERGILYSAEKNQPEMICFFRPPDFCMGQYESQDWTPRSWLADQEVEIYHKMAAHWAELKHLFQSNPWGPGGPDGPQAKMAFMASYNIDRFRDFIFQSSFLKRYKVTLANRKKIRTDDVKLLRFGFEWIKFYLWGIKTPYLSSR